MNNKFKTGDIIKMNYDHKTALILLLSIYDKKQNCHKVLLLHAFQKDINKFIDHAENTHGAVIGEVHQALRDSGTRWHCGSARCC